MKTVTKPSGVTNRLLRSLALAFLFCFAGSSALHAQGTGVVCPPNLDFSFGNLNNWQAFTGSVTNSGSTWILTLGAAGSPVTGTAPYYGCTGVTGTARHAITSGVGSDCYGGFSEVAPGGGLYSARHRQ